MVNLHYKNNVGIELVLPILASAGSIVLPTGAGDLIGTNFPLKAKLTQKNATNSALVDKREIILITARPGTADTLTVTRANEAIPLSSSSLSHQQVAQDFASGSFLEIVDTAGTFDYFESSLDTLTTSKLSLTGGTMTGALLQAQSADIASATTTDLGTMTGDSGIITGTTTIVSFGTVDAGAIKHLTFSGILTLTHNATSMILPNAGSNITTAAGDVAIMKSLWSGNWKCLGYTKANGTALVATLPSSATTVAEGVARLSTDAEARAWTLTNTIITPAQLAMMKVNYQIKFPVENATYIRTYIGSDQLQASPDYIYTAYSTTATNTRIHRYDRQTNGSYVYRWVIANITVASGGCCGITVIGNYVYVWQYDGGAGGIRVYRLALDLTGSTLMTGTMTMTTPTNRTCMTGDGTDLFFTDYSGWFAVNAVKRWTISGTTLSSGSTISLSVAGSTNWHFLYKYPSWGIYIIDTDANVSSIAYWNNSGTAQTAITCLLSTYTANIEQGMWFFKYAGTACFARMRKNDATNSSDILLQPIDLI